MCLFVLQCTMMSILTQECESPTMLCEDALKEENRELRESLSRLGQQLTALEGENFELKTEV